MPSEGAALSGDTRTCPPTPEGSGLQEERCCVPGCRFVGVGRVTPFHTQPLIFHESTKV